MDNSFFSIFPFQEDEDGSINGPDFSVSWVAAGVDPGNLPRRLLQGTGVGDINKKGKQRREQYEVMINEGGGSNEEEAHKKELHRDLERQRRQEMSTLYASLRSVLPPQFLKGKRSIGDQIHEATKYIGCMQDNIRELGFKRDNIKRVSKNDLQKSGKGGCRSQILPVFVMVQPCWVGVEVSIHWDSMPEGLYFPISIILQVLLEEGLGPVSYNSTKCDGSFNCVIQSEILDNTSIDLQLLQRKLTSISSCCKES